MIIGLGIGEIEKSTLLILANGYPKYIPLNMVIDYSKGGLPQNLKPFELIKLGSVDYN